MSGLCIAVGSILNYSAANKKEPNPYEYSDPEIYKKELEDYTDNQKSLKTAANLFIGAGGIGLFITGVSIGRVTAVKKQENKLSLSIAPSEFNLSIKF